jgi:hypothetical protein
MYDLDKTYFDKIDTAEKAYILGFIFADGGIARVNGISYRLDFTQHANGRDVLEFIRKQLGYAGPILYDQKSGNYVRDRLQISNRYLAEKLERYGVVPNKSLILEKPKNLPNKFIGSFLRGLLDGDGSVGIYSINRTNTRGGMYFNGTENLLEWVRKQIRVHHKLYPKGKIFRLEISKQADLLNAISMLSTSPFGMERKNRIIEKLAAWLEKSPMKTRISKNPRKPNGQLSKRKSKKRSRD